MTTNQYALLLRLLNEAAGMFTLDIGGPGFWQYLKDEAEIEGFQVDERELNFLGSTAITFRGSEGEMTVDWTPPDR